MKVNADLPLVQPCILQRVVHLAEVFVRVAHVAVPQPHLLLLLDAEHPPHFLLQLLCKTCATNLAESRHTHTYTFSNTAYFKATKLTTSSTSPCLGSVMHIDTSKNTKATSKGCHVRHSYAGTVFSHNKLLAWQHPPSRNGDQSSAWLPMRQNNRENEVTHQSSHHVECMRQCTIAYSRWPQCNPNPNTTPPP